MALLEASMAFGSTAISSSTSDTISTNVYNAGSAKKLLAGPHSVSIQGRVTLSAGSGTLSVRARFVGADNAALSTNAEILADTGVHLNKEDGSTALANTDTFFFTLSPANQRAPKQYYGMIYTLGGTTPSATCDGNLVIDDQTSMAGLKAATP
jgi:hypothetical protein